MLLRLANRARGSLPRPRWVSANASLLKDEGGEEEYHERADNVLGNLEATLESLPIEDAMEKKKIGGDFDLTNNMGVLTIKLGDKGTWVLNKQAPNKQIWWSSPLSGPKRYAYNSSSKSWNSIRDSSPLKPLLSQELESVLSLKVRFPDVD